MTRGGIGCGFPPHGTPLTSVDVAPHLDEHDCQRVSRPQEFNGAVQSLAAHVVVERCELGHQASEYLEGRAVPQCPAVGPVGGDTPPHLSGRDEDVVGVGLVVVCFVALVWNVTMRGLDQWLAFTDSG